MGSEKYATAARFVLDDLAQMIEVDEDGGTVTTTKECERVIVRAIESAVASAISERDSEVQRLREALEMFVTAWDADEIGQIDGSVTDVARQALKGADE